jgi:hypothetical protein
MKRKYWHVIHAAIGLSAIVMAFARATSGQEAPSVTPPQDAEVAPQVPKRPPQIPKVPPPVPEVTPQDAEESPPSTEVVPLERGPVHEAFAEPTVLDAQPDLLVERQPPDPVPELPPDARPEGDNVVWIPGYWAWSEDVDDFIWVSGVWRDVPPGHEWVPGYWDQTSEGYRWIHGYWTSGDSADLQYLPEPPQSLEAGPPSPQPGPDYFYIPGCWKWNTGSYAWRPGFWHPAQANWLWTPSRYYYTPRGYLYLNGYWDYPLYRRGLLFAPVHFHRPLYLRRGFFFTPYASIHLPLLTHGLFIAPHRRHYFFGSYYGPRFRSRGFYPWFDYHHHRFGYDPLFVHASWRHRGHEKQWLDDLRSDYRRFDEFDGDGPSERIPTPDRIAGRGPDGDRRPDLDRDRGPVLDGDRDRVEAPRFVRNLDTIRDENLTRLTDEQRRQAAERSSETQERLRKRRTEIESQPAPADAAVRGRIARDGIGGRSPGDGVDERSRRGRVDGTRPDRSERRSFGQPRDGQPRADESRIAQPRDTQSREDQSRIVQPRDRQPRVDEPRIVQPGDRQPRVDQPRNLPEARQSRVIRPDVQQPEARRRPEIRQPRTTESLQPRGSTIPNIRGGIPDARSRGFSPQPRQSDGNFSSRGTINRGAPFGSSSRSFSAQPRQSPGNFSGRGGFDRGGGLPSGGAARGISPGGSPSINRGGSAPSSRGGGGGGGGGGRGGSGRRSR